MADAKKAKVNVLEDFRKMDEKQLLEKVADLRKELVEQHRAHKASELPSTAAIAKTRKSIAKAMTVLGEKVAAVPAQKEEEK
jgi:ribosomal protein L29